MGRPLTVTQEEQFVRHGRELWAWNAVVNLTAVTRVGVLAERQFLDVIPLADILPPGWRVLDVGSGGGFPGVPLKVLRPDLKVSLIDGVRKKTAFLRHLVRTLGLSDMAVRQVRAEDLAKEGKAAWREWDGVVAKAVGSPEQVVPWCSPLVKAGGWLVLMGGDEESRGDEAAGKAGFEVTRHPYRLPVSGKERCLVVYQKGRR
jgi:16S rRNA (guanine527-N7)-methyltransferase